MRIKAVVGCCVYWLVGPALADITTDGSLGAGARDIRGPQYDIKAEYGKRQGQNLYHSFSRFNVLSGESATFESEAGVGNIIARVTGNTHSQILGQVRVDSPNTNFWLLNPKGVMIGAGASLAIHGAFYIGTGDGIRFGQNEIFSAQINENQSYSAAAPSGYNFGPSANSGTILVSGANFTSTSLTRLGLVSREISVNNSNIKIVDGKVELVAASPNSSVRFDANEGVIVDGTSPGGLVDIAKSTLDVSSGSATELTILAGDINVSNSQIALTASASAKSGRIDMDAKTIKISANSKISTNNMSTSDSIRLRAESDLDIDASVVASSSTQKGGIELGGKEIHIGRAAVVHTLSSNGAAGNISIRGNQIIVSGSTLESASSGTETGSISLSAKELRVADTSAINVEAKNNAVNRGVKLDADDVQIKDSRIALHTRQGASDSLVITVNGGAKITGASVLETSTDGSGRGGDIVVRAASSVDSGEDQQGTLIRTESSGEGAAGKIEILSNGSVDLHTSTLRVNSAKNESGSIIVKSARGSVGESNIEVLGMGKILDERVTIEVGTRAAPSSNNANTPVEPNSSPSHVAASEIVIESQQRVEISQPNIAPVMANNTPADSRVALCNGSVGRDFAVNRVQNVESWGRSPADYRFAAKRITSGGVKAMRKPAVAQGPNQVSQGCSGL